ncbi:MATE family efflux transporter [Fusobacterium sp. PH5-44]|uniref:MATE family efflux transporter n=1 Tax=unclassified Fusobacterium TaxID=2648384 RepID=UPI003D1D050D
MLMTEGKVYKNLINFAFPIFLSNVLFQLYNTTDAVILGRFVGKDALASVGAASPIMNISIFFIVGLTLGASILMAEFYGANDIKKLKQEIATVTKAGTIFIVFLSFIAYISTSKILFFLNTPCEIIKNSEEYLKIIFSGLIFCFLYNNFTSQLRAIGDSKTPSIVLTISISLNIILDIIFIKYFNLGVNGAAYATVLAQLVGCIILFVNIYLKKSMLQLKFKDYIINFSLLKITTKYSISYAIQQTIIFLGNILIQGIINPLGINSIAAFNASTRVDGFILAPGDSMGAALTTFISQNRGANKNDRIFTGFKNSILISLIYCLIISVITISFSKEIMHIFMNSSETEAIYLGQSYIKTISLFYFLTAFCNTLQGFFRGLGKMNVTLIATLIQIPIRIILAYFLTKYYGISGIAISMGIGWIFMFMYEAILYKKFYNENSRN